MDVDDFAQKLHDWAIHTMGFRPEGKYINSRMPTVDDFRGLCRGHMVDVWKFVMSNVQPGQWPIKKRGYRVKYQSAQVYSEEKERDLEARRQAAKLNRSKQDALLTVEMEVEQLQREISAIEQENQDTWNEIRCLQRKAAALRAHSQLVKTNIKKVEGFTKMLMEQCGQIKSLARSQECDSSVMYSRKGSSGEEGDDGDGLLETACKKEVRETCEAVQHFLGKLLGGEFGEDKQLLENERKSLWKKVDQLTNSHSSVDILNSLITFTQDVTLELNDKTSRIDARKDAENLMFRYENDGRLTDLSTQPSPVQTIHQLVQKSRTEEFKRFIEIEKHKNSIWKGSQELESVTEDVMRGLCSQYSDNPGNVELAKAFYETRLKVASAKASVEALQKCVANFKQKITSAKKEKDILHQKYQKIQDFKKVVDSKQNLIQVLVRQNLNARSNIDNQKIEIEHYIQQSVTSHEGEIQALTGQLKDNVLKEVQTFGSLDMSKLMFTMLESAHRIAVIDLSINRLHTNKSSPQGLLLSQLMTNLQFAPFKAPEYLMPKIMEIGNEIYQIESALKRNKLITDAFEGCDLRKLTSEAQIAMVCKSVDEQDQQQRAELLPVLQKRISNATQALTNCISIKAMAESWWEQPAQYCVPWLLVDQQTLQQWREKWTVEVTRLRQERQASI